MRTLPFGPVKNRAKRQFMACISGTSMHIYSRFHEVSLAGGISGAAVSLRLAARAARPGRTAPVEDRSGGGAIERTAAPRPPPCREREVPLPWREGEGARV